MTLKFYLNESTPNTLDKTITEKATVTGQLMQASDIIAPTIRIQGDYLSLVTTANYVYIPDFGRYYYINNYVAVLQNVYDLHIVCDPLMSWKDYIKECYGILGRSETNYTLYMDDPNFMVFSNPQIQLKKFTKYFDVENNMNFILAISGNGGAII